MLSWYPITPSSSLAESIIGWIPKIRTAEDGGSTCAVIQAEDELAAAGMVVGAGWAGGRGMTATSGPGISLMSEFIGLAYFAEVPGVIWDVNRVGPSTGLPSFGMSIASDHPPVYQLELSRVILACCMKRATETLSTSSSFQEQSMSASNSAGAPSTWPSATRLLSSASPTSISA